MKINQFAQLHPEITTIKNELNTIGFPTSATTTTALFKNFLQTIFWQFPATSDFYAELDQYLATPSTSLGRFIKDKESITNEVFYLVALQLLDFEADDDFQIESPIASMKNLGLFTLNNIKSTNDLVTAYYNLLNTHTKNGLTLIDKLAAQGYYTQHHFKPNQQLIFNGKAQATFLAQNFIYETVYVQTDFDSDFDGKNDLIKVEITRPKTNMKVAVAYTASPYDQGTNDLLGEKLTHNVNVSLTKKPVKKNKLMQTSSLIRGKKPLNQQPATNATHTHTPKPGYTLNDYLLVRGFASVYAAGIGTVDSDGLQTCGDAQQTASTIAVIEWLHGDRTAYTNRTDYIPVKANWSNGNVAMTGRSYLGTLAVAAATTGVKGLKTIIAEAAISSWYDYYRENGLVIAPGGFQGEDADVLAGETFSRSLRLGDYQKIKPAFIKELSHLTSGQDRKTGSYNQFWHNRNYRNNLKNIKADIMLVHGLNDWNVKLKNPAKLWRGIQQLPISKKLILHQGQHIYINAFPSFDFSDLVNLWLTHELYNINNQAEKIIPNVIVQDNVKADTWNSKPNWLSQTTTNFPLVFSKTQFKNEIAPQQFIKYCQNPDKWQTDLLNPRNDTLNDNRLIANININHDTTINGNVTIKLRIKSNQDIGMISALLLDSGNANRLQESPTILKKNGVQLGYRWYTDDLRELLQNKQQTPFKIISRAHLNLQNRHDSSQNEIIEPDKFYDVSFDLQPTYYHLPAGRKLTLVLYATDFQMTIRGNQAIHYKIDQEHSSLDIPFQ
ncbi:Xaa-Pro dipeptidyl-peptidase [Fructilactobacillus lindneri]|uniref:Xaa-Pro dipeptidyl-peptidase n=2 Tax=Fructilactobacillus lindneri TaxID=53444 RepID=A0A0R2JV63_9LACO|nr:Xaa-Pro dipeptidyl-peptidase [Fructilactobacillus lindneri]ANZ57911.1 X-prolyl-dipeptidyl aminopeptidase [Fructilactobacillus lindneri]ANZ59181.1 X-prolyl-dipeptidyl aminopeptidase [Fructilactobacillus lindneri]KRN78618.1 Xaa-Pro dipeptidase [Fructilactobacillus lindneri DSM 20690 = JCM 11027]POG98231.1 Xaa-Pro dipeptidyl-peptidase [Fructilactobacillus lindneri]POH01652.1 Xaa-Pro dipeptidyl-peptidase [Fructilactobacillus lindneri]